MQVVKKIGVMSAARIGALFGIVVGLIMGVIMALASSVPAAAASMVGVPTWMIGWRAVLILPIFYAVLYFISAVIGVALYNLFAKWVGGVKVDLSK